MPCGHNCSPRGARRVQYHLGDGHDHKQRTAVLHRQPHSTAQCAVFRVEGLRSPHRIKEGQRAARVKRRPRITHATVLPTRSAAPRGDRTRARGAQEKSVGARATTDKAASLCYYSAADELAKNECSECDTPVLVSLRAPVVASHRCWRPHLCSTAACTPKRESPWRTKRQSAATLSDAGRRPMGCEQGVQLRLQQHRGGSAAAPQRQWPARRTAPSLPVARQAQARREQSNGQVRDIGAHCHEPDARGRVVRRLGGWASTPSVAANARSFRSTQLLVFCARQRQPPKLAHMIAVANERYVAACPPPGDRSVVHSAWCLRRGMRWCACGACSDERAEQLPQQCRASALQCTSVRLLHCAASLLASPRRPLGSTQCRSASTKRKSAANTACVVCA